MKSSKIYFFECSEPYYRSDNYHEKADCENAAIQYCEETHNGVRVCVDKPSDDKIIGYVSYDDTTKKAYIVRRMSGELDEWLDKTGLRTLLNISD